MLEKYFNTEVLEGEIKKPTLSMPKKIEFGIKSIKSTLIIDSENNKDNFLNSRLFECLINKLKWTLTFRKQNLEEGLNILINSLLKILSFEVKTEEIGDDFSFFKISNFLLDSQYKLEEKNIEKNTLIEINNVLNVKIIN